MELLNLNQNGYKFIIEGTIGKFKSVDTTIDKALLIKTKISGKEKNETIKDVYVFDLEAVYDNKLKIINWPVLFHLMVDFIGIDKIHLYDLMDSLEELFNENEFDFKDEKINYKEEKKEDIDDVENYYEDFSPGGICYEVYFDLSMIPRPNQKIDGIICNPCNQDVYYIHNLVTRNLNKKYEDHDRYDFYMDYENLDKVYDWVCIKIRIKVTKNMTKEDIRKKALEFAKYSSMYIIGATYGDIKKV